MNDLDDKLIITQIRIRQWYEHWDGMVYISFSGGKDSTVLLDIVRKIYPEVPAVFVDTGLEYPEIRDFVKTIDNVTWVRPKMTYKQVIDKYGYPVASKDVAQKIHEIRTTKSDKLKNKRMNGDNKGNGKLPVKWRSLIKAPFKVSHKCCDILKKNPAKSYEKETNRKPYIGTMTQESRQRKQAYNKNGCNAYDGPRPKSSPISLWNDMDIWNYIKSNNIEYASIYKKGADRTGCMFCAFGVHMEKGENRFQRMAKTHPRQYNTCMNKLGMKSVLDYIGIDVKPYPEQLSIDFDLK